MTVPPDTLAKASCSTLAAAEPLRRVSSLRCPPHGLWALGAAAGTVAAVSSAALLDVELVAAVEPELEPVAAAAMP